MFAWLDHLRKKYDDWCGDLEMETSIRKHLSANGYFGTTAKFQAVRLVAIERPGWQQIYRFEVTARVNPGDLEDERDPDPEYHCLFGLVREDRRHDRSDVRVFKTPSQRQEMFARWSEGLICLRGAKGLLPS